MAGAPSNNLAIIGALADQLASSGGALLGDTGTAAEVDERASPAWFVTTTVTGARQGTLTLGFVAAEAAALARQAMGFDEDPEDEVVADMLREVCGQAFGALTQTPEGKGSLFAVEVPSRAPASPPAGPALAFRLRLGTALTTIVTVWDGLAAPVAIAPAGPAIVTAAPPAPPAQAPAARPAPAYPNLDVILDIDLPLSVRFGETEMTVDALTKLGPGSVIDLGRSPDDPVDVLVNGRMVARGEVVVVAGSYGVRILEVVSAADRLRTMAA